MQKTRIILNRVQIGLFLRNQPLLHSVISCDLPTAVIPQAIIAGSATTKIVIILIVTLHRRIIMAPAFAIFVMRMRTHPAKFFADLQPVMTLALAPKSTSSFTV